MKIQLVEKKYCTGCGSCVQACPKHAITMQEDAEGFLYPVVSEKRCVKCNLCFRVCPIINSSNNEQSVPISSYAAKHNDEIIRFNSSSGGVFFAIAQKVLNEKGVVFGVVFDKNWEAYHKFAETVDDVLHMMGSKYMQSRIENSFAEAEHFLKTGRKVLFTGTPCQVKGLHSYLRQNYNNLITVDIICHGVPSPMVWRKNLLEFCQVNNIRAINKINFRNKKFGWKKWNVHMNASDNIEKNKDYYFTFNGYIQGFMSNIYLRPSCQYCSAKSGKSHSDITIADFWGIEHLLPDFDDSKGTSLLFANTFAGNEIISNIDLTLVNVDFNYSIKSNPSWGSTANFHFKREYFFRKLKKNRSVTKLTQQCLQQPIYKRLINKVRRIAKKFF